MDAVGGVLFGGSLPEKQGRLLKWLFGQVDGAAVETIKRINKFS